MCRGGGGGGDKVGLEECGGVVNGDGGGALCGRGAGGRGRRWWALWVERAKGSAAQVALYVFFVVYTALGGLVSVYSESCLSLGELGYIKVNL